MPEKKNSIWVTGASSGIGKEIAKEFARIGRNVYASSRRANLLELINRELKPQGLKVNIAPCNVASTVNVDQTAKTILKNGPIDCLVNNAGISVFKSALETSNKEIKDIISVNLLGSISCIKAVLPSMIERKRGTIINIISVTAEQAFTNSSAYAASKAGLMAFADSLREEVREHNIRVISILPGATSTAIWPKKVLEKYTDRMMKPEDVARVAVSAYLNDSIAVQEKILLKPIGGDL